MGMGLNGYTNTFEGYIGNLGVMSALTNDEVRAWVASFAEHCGMSPNEQGHYNILTVCQADTEAYLNVEGVLFVGSEPLYYNWANSYGLIYTNYSSSGIGIVDPADGWKTRIYLKISQFRKPSQTLLWTDGSSSYIWPSWGVTRARYWAQYRHQGKANVVFFDGHVESEYFEDIDNDYCELGWP
jgi:prepilin-type processing-associated H-X9-DG protein